MRVEKVLVAQASRFVTLTPATLYVPDVVKVLQQRYGFVRVPTMADELLPPEGQPLVFNHGKFVHEGRPIIIRALQAYSHAMVVETETSTDECDLVLDDILTAAPELIKAGRPLEQIYASQLEVSLTNPLDRACPISTQIGVMLSQVIGDYVKPPSPIPVPQVFALGMQPDPKKRLLVCDFRIERRVGFPYEANIYFAQAPLRTRDHITILMEFDRLNGGVSR